MRRLTLRVGKRDAGERLDRFIADSGGIARGLARRVIDAGGVFLDERRCKVAGRVVHEGQAVVVNLEESGRAPVSSGTLERARLLYQDGHLVVVDKPPFVASQPTLTTDRGTLPDLVASAIGGPVILVHRLDRETSGVMVLARTRAAAAHLADAFRAGELEKSYLALTARAPEPAEGTIDASIGRDPARPGRRIVTAGGETACTRYRTERLAPSGIARVACHPATGRTHQIRVHLAHASAPLLGDPRYGGPRRVGETSIPRVMLHAARLSFQHPVTGAQLVVPAPPPTDFVEVERALFADAAPPRP